MFNYPLFACVAAVCLPGILVTVPYAVKTMSAIARAKLPPGSEMPALQAMALTAVVQSSMLCTTAAALGTALAPKADLHAPFFEALASGAPLLPAFRSQLLPSLTVGVFGALVFVAAYYWLFRPRLDRGTVKCMENLRNGIGIWGRVLYGGVAEEVLTRWGLMSLLVWLGNLLVGAVNPAVVWVVIVISGVLFGIGHAPSYLAAGCQKAPIFFVTMLSLNVWGSLIFGWLFWQHGLLSAMMAHVLFHLVWLPFDLYYHQPVTQDLAA